MTPKKLQKQFYISDESIKHFIDYRIEDLAKITGSSTSFVIEQSLLDGLLPDNTDARSFVFNYLYNKDDKFSVRSTLDKIFAWNNAGIDWNSKHDNFRQLVEFCLFNLNGDTLLPKANGTMHSFLYSFNSVIKRAEKELDLVENIIDKSQYFSSLDYAKTLYEQAKDNTIQIGIKFFYEVLLDMWNIIKGWSMTYRALSALASMSNFCENEQTRIALADLVEQVSGEW